VFNVLVDLCGVVKRSGVREVKEALTRHFGKSGDDSQCGFEYIYHIDQV
jgi:hypothetical protein